jgi:hypothetical protein
MNENYGFIKEHLCCVLLYYYYNILNIIYRTLLVFLPEYMCMFITYVYLHIYQISSLLVYIFALFITITIELMDHIGTYPFIFIFRTSFFSFFINSKVFKNLCILI